MTPSSFLSPLSSTLRPSLPQLCLPLFPNRYTSPLSLSTLCLSTLSPFSMEPRAGLGDDAQIRHLSLALLRSRKLMLSEQIDSKHTHTHVFPRSLAPSRSSLSLLLSSGQA